MTKLERLRTAAAIPPAFRGTGRVARSLDLIQGRVAGTLEFNSNVWKAAKPQLKLETGGKCAYCESPTDTVAHGDVEHYRPKSKYWWLAYCYDNYLYACQICNQVSQGRRVSDPRDDRHLDWPRAARAADSRGASRRSPSR